MKMETNLTLDQEVLITIKSIGINGEGVGFYKRQAVFVDGVIPPEEVVVRITKLKKGYAEAEPVRIKKRAFYRTRPFCKHYGVCGGCQLQHAEYEEQQRLKEAFLKQTFERFSGLDINKVTFNPFNPIVKPKHYFQTAVMPVMNTDEGIVTGLMKKDHSGLTEVLECPITDNRINAVNQQVLEICDEYEIHAFDASSMRGLLRHIVTRRSLSTGEVQVTMVITIFNHVLKEAAKKILDIPDVVSVAISKDRDAKSTATFGETVEILAGKETIDEQLGDTRFRLSPKAYYQKNPQEAQNMYEYIATLFEPAKETSLLDLYTGSGAMALYFAGYFKRITGIDRSRESIESAKANRKLNNADHTEFIESDVAEALKKIHGQGEKYDVVVFDPPRQGLSKAITDLLLKKPFKKLIYVSANPATLAKDIRRLTRKFRVISVMPFDMYPQTSHIESVTLLELK